MYGRSKDSPAAGPSTSVRVLIVGDTGVGKTALLNALLSQAALAQDAPLAHDAAGPRDGAEAHAGSSSSSSSSSRSTWTIGANVEVMGHTHAKTGQTAWVELVDVGGSAKYAAARSVFYAGAHGVILVHDATNRNSYANLMPWLSEIAYATAHDSDLPMDAGGNIAIPSFDLEEYMGSPIASCPLLVVANKIDQSGAPALPRPRSTTTTTASSSAAVAAAAVSRSSSSASGSAGSGLRHGSAMDAMFSALNAAYLATTATDPAAGVDGPVFAEFFDRIIDAHTSLGTEPRARRGSSSMRMGATSVLFKRP